MDVVAASGLVTSALGDDLPLAPVNVAALLLVLMKLGMNELLGDVGDTAPWPLGVGNGEPLGDRPPNGELGNAICVGRFPAARDMMGRG